MHPALAALTDLIKNKPTLRAYVAAAISVWLLSCAFFVWGSARDAALLVLRQDGPPTVTGWVIDEPIVSKRGPPVTVAYRVWYSFAAHDGTTYERVQEIPSKYWSGTSPKRVPVYYDNNWPVLSSVSLEASRDKAHQILWGPLILPLLLALAILFVSTQGWLKRKFGNRPAR